MRLVLTLLVRDEADVIAATIEHHLAAGVDHIIATDNGSVDGTRNILAAYRDAGVLDIIDEPANTYAQAEWVTRMARLAAEQHHADWVVNADADEFWWPRDSDSLKQTLAIIPRRYGSVQAPRENLLADPGCDGPWPHRLVIRDLLSLHEKGGRIGGKVCHRADADVSVEQGNHAVSGGSAGEAWPASPITVLHVPDRSYAQFANKIRVGGSSLANNASLPKGSGWHWRADYERLRAGTLREAWQGRQLTAEQVEAGLREGRLVYDDRLLRRMTTLLPIALRPDLLAAAVSGGGRGAEAHRQRVGSSRKTAT